MPKIVFDIETAGEDFDQMDKTTQKALTRWAKEETKTEEELEGQIEKIKNELVFSPFTGMIVSVGVIFMDDKLGAADRQVVYYQNRSEGAKDELKDGVEYKVMDEEGILKKFWELASYADEFITFNGRGFDAPYLAIRSAVHKIKPSKNLLANRYLNLMPRDAKHVDLMDQFIFYGATWKRPSLHLACRAFGIKSPKEEDVSGDDVTRLFNEGEYLTIAEYNMRDVVATKQLYQVWRDYVGF